MVVYMLDKSNVLMLLQKKTNVDLMNFNINI